MLHLSKNFFSRVYQELMLLAFREVNYVKAFSVKVLGKTLHSIASSLKTKPIADLYLQICSCGFILLLYRMNCGNFKLVYGRTSLIHFPKGPILKAFRIRSDHMTTRYCG